MSYLEYMAAKLQRELEILQARAQQASDSAALFATGDARAKIVAFLPFLRTMDMTERSSQLYPYARQLDVPVKFVLRSEKGDAMKEDLLSESERDFLRQLNEMKPGDTLYRVFWHEAAKATARAPLEDFLRAEFSHYCNCLGVAERLWPEESHEMPDAWREHWRALKTRLADVKESELA